MDEDIHGLQELLKSMDELPLSLQKTLIVRALRKGAEPIRARAEELAPIDTGKLKELMMITIADQSASSATAKIGPARKTFYGGFQEFGTIYDKAQPFLRPAFDEQQEEALRLIGEDLAAGIEREMKKL